MVAFISNISNMLGKGKFATGHRYFLAFAETHSLAEIQVLPFFDLADYSSLNFEDPNA
jgi:hypothetical protein